MGAVTRTCDAGTRCILCGVLLLIHGLLLVWIADQHSVVVDEDAHLAAGISHWQFGRFELYKANPPLPREVAALAVMAGGANTEWRQQYEVPGARAEFAIGRAFIKVNGPKTFWYFTLGRWALLPLSLLGAWICYRWAGELYGQAAALLALGLWCFSPNILGNAPYVMPDAAATAVGAAASYVLWRWLRESTWEWTLAAGLALGLVQLTKMTWLVLFAVWPVLSLIWFVRCALRNRVRRSTEDLAPVAGYSAVAAVPRKSETCGQPAWRPHETTPERDGDVQAAMPRGTQPGGWRQVRRLGAILLLGLLVLNLGYGFEGSFQKLGAFEFVSQTLKGERESAGSLKSSGNRFAGTWLGEVPVPLPRNYVLGVDIVKRQFEAGRQTYLAGEFQNHGWWYYYLYAVGVKVPLATWVLAIVALSLTLCRCHTAKRLGRKQSTDDAAPRTWRDTLVLLAPLATLLVLVSANTGLNEHLRYVLPIFPFAFIWISQVAYVFGRRIDYEPSSAAGEVSDRSRWIYPFWLRALVGGALVWSIASSLSTYPHSASYFNELGGGPRGGHSHLISSNVDRGQDLLYLQRWLDAHPEARPLGLAYYGIVDPRIAGIEFRLPPPGPVRDDGMYLRAPDRLGPQPGWYAVSVHILRGSQSPVYDGKGGHSDLPFRAYCYFLDFEPVALAGYSIYIYHITLDEANRVRRKLGLAELVDGR